MDDAKVAEEFDRRAASQPNLNAVLDAQDTPEVRRGNRLRDYISRAAVVRVVQPRAHEEILDFGCGVGRLTFPVGHRARRVIGIDVAAKMIEAAEARLSREQSSNVAFIHAPTLPLPLADSSIDKAFACWALAHISDELLRHTLADVRRCLKPGGRFFAFEQVRDRPRESEAIHKQRSPHDYAAWFASEGYRLVGSLPVMRSPSYALGLWNRFERLPSATLPLLELVERMTADRKPGTADYVTVAFTFER